MHKAPATRPTPALHTFRHPAGPPRRRLTVRASVAVLVRAAQRLLPARRWVVVDSASPGDETPMHATCL